MAALERAFRGRDATLRLFWHAALPVAVAPEILHLLRINFFAQGEDTLSYEAEADILLSPLCVPVGDDLYEIDPDVRTVLLQKLFDAYGPDRLREAALLLWHHGEKHRPWDGRPKLERAQELTALSLLDPPRAREWLEKARREGGAFAIEERGWFAAMSQEVERDFSTRPRDRAGEVDWPLPPLPEDANWHVRRLVEMLEGMYARRRRLTDLGADLTEIDEEIRLLKRELREGGQLREGDALREGRYLLTQRIGVGGFATVWRAFDRASKEFVAAKVLHPQLTSNWELRERFFRGARTIARLNHPAIVRVLDPQGEDLGFHYYVMELVTGGDVEQAVRERRIRPEHAMDLILSVGDALAYAHRQGVVHRDVKPGNILLDADMRPKLTDFDLVVGLDTTGGTRTGPLGTVLYAAPEQLERPGRVGPSADVYSLAMVLAFVLRGTPLRLADRAPELQSLDLPERLLAVVLKAAAPDPEERFADAGAFCAALRDAFRPSGRPGGASMAVLPALVHVPRGRFRMGVEDAQEGRPFEKPARWVEVRALEVMKVPVTRDLFRQVMGADARPSALSAGREDLPVTQVSFLQAIQFCNRLSALNDLRPAYRLDGSDVVCDWEADGFRLPTEAEWEHAARGEDGRIYPWGNDFDPARACWSGDRRSSATRAMWRKEPCPVGMFPGGRSPYGLLDMAGGVWEWCWDRFSPYEPVEQILVDPRGPARSVPVNPPVVEGDYRVLRGGAWNIENPGLLRCTARAYDLATVVDPDIGFRAVRNAK